MAANDKILNTTTGNTLYETFFQKAIGDDYYETIYVRNDCIEEFRSQKIAIPFFSEKFAYRMLVIGKKCFYITDNPPRNLDNRIDYADVVDIQVVRLFGFYLQSTDTIWFQNWLTTCLHS
jgi:hypothetical protein